MNAWGLGFCFVMGVFVSWAGYHSRNKWLHDPALDEELARVDREIDAAEFERRMERIEFERDRLEQESKRIQVKYLERMMR